MCMLCQALLMHIAHDGVTTTDLFRRNGSSTDVRFIIAQLSAGCIVDFTSYTFYTLATVVKVESCDQLPLLNKQFIVPSVSRPTNQISSIAW